MAGQLNVQTVVESSPFMTREGGARDLKVEENLLLDFAIWQHHLLASESVIRSSMYAVRFICAVRGAAGGGCCDGCTG